MSFEQLSNFILKPRGWLIDSISSSYRRRDEVLKRKIQCIVDCRNLQEIFLML